MDDLGAEGRANAIFDRAKGVEAELRRAFIVEACAGDDALLRQVEELLEESLRVTSGPEAGAGNSGAPTGDPLARTAPLPGRSGRGRSCRRPRGRCGRPRTG